MHGETVKVNVYSITCHEGRVEGARWGSLVKAVPLVLDSWERES